MLAKAAREQEQKQQQERAAAAAAAARAGEGGDHSGATGPRGSKIDNRARAAKQRKAAWSAGAGRSAPPPPLRSPRRPNTGPISLC